MSSTSPPPPSAAMAARADVREAQRPYWGLGDVWVGLLCSQLMAGVVVAITLSAGGWDTTDEAPLWTTGLFAIGLHGTLALVAVAASHTKGFGIVRDYSVRMVSNDIGVGIISGVLAQLVLVPLVTFPIIWLTDTDLEDVSRSATELADRATTPIGVTVLIVTVAIVAPAVEELFFRGLMLRSFMKRRNFAWLERALPAPIRPDTTSQRWNNTVAVVASSLIFGITHFQLILVPALSMAGAVFAILAVRRDRLGPAIWAHVAFNGTTLINLLA